MDTREKLKRFMRDNRIEGEHLAFERSCHSVEEGSRAANARMSSRTSA